MAGARATKDCPMVDAVTLTNKNLDIFFSK